VTATGEPAPRPLLPLDGRMTIIPLALAVIWAPAVLVVIWLFINAYRYERDGLQEDREVAELDAIWEMPEWDPRGRV
jgi:hypothetical protein